MSRPTTFDASLDGRAGGDARPALLSSVVPVARDVLWTVGQLVAIARHRLERRRLLAASMSDEQLALLVAEAWGGSPRYAMPAAADALKARDLVEHARLVHRAARLPEVE